MLKKIIITLRRRLYYLFNYKKYRYLAPNVVIQKLLRIDGKQNITIENSVIIQKMTWLAALPLTNQLVCHLSIGEGSIIGNFNHIYATGEILIGKNVLTADKVYITDNLHQYENIDMPIMSQGIKQLSRLVIGDGSWIGENVCIIGASIGKNSVIGANSVVTKDIPDYCVAVGSPAKVIKKYNIISQKWEKV